VFGGEEDAEEEEDDEEEKEEDHMNGTAPWSGLISIPPHSSPWCPNSVLEVTSSSPLDPVETVETGLEWPVDSGLDEELVPLEERLNEWA
jgi:hypothetical protein